MVRGLGRGLPMLDIFFIQKVARLLICKFIASLDKHHMVKIHRFLKRVVLQIKLFKGKVLFYQGDRYLWPHFCMSNL